MCRKTRQFEHISCLGFAILCLPPLESLRRITERYDEVRTNCPDFRFPGSVLLGTGSYFSVAGEALVLGRQGLEGLRFICNKLRHFCCIGPGNTVKNAGEVGVHWFICNKLRHFCCVGPENNVMSCLGFAVLCLPPWNPRLPLRSPAQKPRSPAQS